MKLRSHTGNYINYQFYGTPQPGDTVSVFHAGVTQEWVYRGPTASGEVLVYQHSPTRWPQFEGGWVRLDGLKEISSGN